MTKILAGRRFAPAALALMVVSVSIGWNRVFSQQNPMYVTVGVFALIVGVTFFVAWWANRSRWMRGAFLASTALWLFVAGTSYTVIGNIPSAVSAISWAILSAGSFWYESGDAEEPRER